MERSVWKHRASTQHIPFPYTPGFPRAGAKGLNKGLNKATMGCLSPGGHKASGGFVSARERS